ncbi:MAG: DUF2974 domain-containing protein [Oscillibacter sp.]|jgi:hypothetical protein|nr:DUF2974 domain-containing protein [Oscillibacter sp.]
MANILDYLDWRGDLTLRQAPFCAVDNLILAELSFVDFSGIVPEPGAGAGVELRQAAEAFFRARADAEGRVDMGVLVPAAIPVMLEKMAASRRFGEMRLSCFTDQLDQEKSEQFAALSAETGDGAVYLSFRGTDDTIAGWKEDFLLGCLPEIPAQKKAVEYVRAVARQFPRKKLRLGGHSKGGNLAVYGGMYCPAAVQRRIGAIYSNDGPGFYRDVLQSPQHRQIEDRIHSIVPKSSVVGMLLEHEEAYSVVDSSQMGFLQHDGFSWLVLGDHFLTLREMSEQSRIADRELAAWIRALPEVQRESFVNALFSVLAASGAATLTDLRADRLKAVGGIVRAMKELDKTTRDALLDFVGLLFRTNFRMVLGDLQEESGKRVLEARRHFKLLPDARGEK